MHMKVVKLSCKSIMCHIRQLHGSLAWMGILIYFARGLTVILNHTVDMKFAFMWD